MKTVRELSQEIGITKQSINYYIRQNKNKFGKHIKKIGQTNKLDNEAQNTIKEHFKQSDRAKRNKQKKAERESQNNQNKREPFENFAGKKSESTGKTQLEQSQEETIKILREELASRREELKTAQNLIDQQQRLTLQTNNTIEYLREENKQLKLTVKTSEKNQNKPEYFENESKDSENSTGEIQKGENKKKKGWKFWK